MRISDWSSDVCSSDLLRRAVAVDQDQGALAAEAAQVGERAGLGRATRLRAELADRVEVGGTQVVGDGHFAAGVDRGAVDDRDRHGAFDLGTLQARTGDLDAVEGGGLAGSAFLVLRSEEHTLTSSHYCAYRMPSSA